MVRKKKLDTCLQKTKDDRSWNSASEPNDDELWRVCIDSKMTKVQRFYWSAVYRVRFTIMGTIMGAQFGCRIDIILGSFSIYKEHGISCLTVKFLSYEHLTNYMTM